jgi:hypothetical protein
MIAPSREHLLEQLDRIIDRIDNGDRSPALRQQRDDLARLINEIDKETAA